MNINSVLRVPYIGRPNKWIKWSAPVRPVAAQYYNEAGNLQVLHVTLHRKEGPHIGPEFHMATFLLGHGHGRQWPLRSEQVYLDDCEALPRRGGQCGQSGDAERYADAMDGVYCYECWAQVE